METRDSVHKLIQNLDIKYPDKMAKYELTPFEQGFRAGQRVLIDTLKDEYKFGTIETIEKEK